MAALADDDDLAARLGRALTTAEAARTPALLADASALIRAYTRQDFDVAADDEVVLRPVGVRLRLPQRPVTAVASVVALPVAGGTATTLSVSDWTWDGADIVELDSWYPNWAPHGTYRVTYSHGAGVVPADVVAVGCRMVLAALLAPTMAEGLVQERIGQYSYQYGQQAGSGSPGATVRLSEADKGDLRRYRRSAGTIQLRAR